MKRSESSDADPGPDPGRGPASAAGAGARRCCDIAISGLLLLLLSPLLAFVAAAVALDSPGPVLFGQRRVGRDGAEFTMWKFRSMHSGRSGPQVTTSDDARITRVGKWLRNSSVDELPQLWCVLRGQMALVGPRPEVPELARRYPPECRAIFAHRPGMTGPGQLRFRDRNFPPPPGADPEGWYLRTVVPRKVAVDLEYLRNQTMGDWVRILFQTFRHVLGRPRHGSELSVGRA